MAYGSVIDPVVKPKRYPKLNPKQQSVIDQYAQHGFKITDWRRSFERSAFVIEVGRLEFFPNNNIRCEEIHFRLDRKGNINCYKTTGWEIDKDGKTLPLSGTMIDRSHPLWLKIYPIVYNAGNGITVELQKIADDDFRVLLKQGNQIERVSKPYKYVKWAERLAAQWVEEAVECEILM